MFFHLPFPLAFLCFILVFYLRLLKSFHCYLIITWVYIQYKKTLMTRFSAGQKNDRLRSFRNLPASILNLFYSMYFSKPNTISDMNCLAFDCKDGGL